MKDEKRTHKQDLAQLEMKKMKKHEFSVIDWKHNFMNLTLTQEMKKMKKHEFSVID